MKIVFWGSSAFSMPSLEALRKEHDIAAVVTNEDACCGRGMKEIRKTPVKRFAEEKGIRVFQPCDLKDADFQNELAALGAELFIVVSYGLLLPEKVLWMPRFHSINLHASLLPKYRGASPIQAVLENGDAITGVSVQEMVKAMDKGPVFRRKEMEILPQDNYLTLSGKLAEAGAEILLETVAGIGMGSSEKTEQADAEATYCRLIRKRDGRISFIDNTAKEIYNKWRAYSAWPGVYTAYRNSETADGGGHDGPDRLDLNSFELKEIRLSEENGKPGTIIRADRQFFRIACREGSLDILTIKPAGKKEMDFQSFINGYRPAAGRYF